MAWNEPGGNSNNQDPWGGRKGGGRQGPPDLDEAFRKLQESLGGIFGGGKRSSGDSSGGGLGMLGIGLLLLLALWLWNAVYIVDEQEQAVVLRFGKYYETVGPGLNIYFPPIDRKFQENVTRERSYSMTGQMLTEDENIVEVPFTIQYKVSKLQDFVLNVDQPEVSLKHATESALRHVAGSTTMDQVIITLSEKNLGSVIVVGADNSLIGIVTDGDLKRHMSADLLSRKVSDIMSAHPRTIPASLLAAEALDIMLTSAKSPITSLIVADDSQKVVGLIRIQELLKAGIA